MALRKCRECGKQISTRAAACPSCGAPISAASRDLGAGGWVLFFLAMLLLVITYRRELGPGPSQPAPASTGSKASESPAAPVDDRREADNEVWQTLVDEPREGSAWQKSMAYSHAKRFVREALKNPRGAKFPRDPISCKHIGDGVYRVRSYVDATNSFGATIRTGFSADVMRTEGDLWVLVDLDFRE